LYCFLNESFKILKNKNRNDRADKGGNMVDIEEESPDLINMEIDFGDKAKDSGDKNEDEADQEIISNILTSDIPAEEWQREVERVASKLKFDFNNFNLNNAEWRGHLENIKTYDGNINKAIPDCRGILENMSQDIDRSLEKISKKETLISKNFVNIVFNIKIISEIKSFYLCK